MRSLLISGSQTWDAHEYNLWGNHTGYPQAFSKLFYRCTTRVFIRSLCRFVAQVYTTVFGIFYGVRCVVLHTIHNPNNKNNKGD